MRTDDFHNSFVQGRPASVFNGPLLSEADYSEVLIAKAFSRGKKLEFVLYPGVRNRAQPVIVTRALRIAAKGATASTAALDSSVR